MKALRLFSMQRIPCVDKSKWYEGCTFWYWQGLDKHISSGYTQDKIRKLIGAGRKTRVHLLAGKTPAFVVLWRMSMKELSIFIDESGDFGEYDKIAPYYIVALIIHRQEAEIATQLQQLEESLAAAGFPHHCIHAGPIIRRENEYALEDLHTRQGILKKLMAFIRHVDINYTTIHIEKKHVKDTIDATGKLSKQLSRLVV